MKNNEQKSNFKFSKIVGFLILILGIVFFTTGGAINKRSGEKGINAMKGFGIAAMVIGAGIQIWQVGKGKK